jgi:hypothetical protein
LRTAWLALRDGVHYRREAFAAGLRACGFDVRLGLPRVPRRGDVLVIWNRYRENARMADAFEFDGLPVLVAENGYLGNDFAGDRWYAISRGQHNGCGTFPEGGAERWDGLGISLSPWRKPGGELVVLPQRGIGPPGVAMPAHWPGSITQRLRSAGFAFRTRPHPGQGKAAPLDSDLAGASGVVTWGSGAALKALTWGIPVFHELPRWIGAGASLPLSSLLSGEPPHCDDAARLATFRRLAWAMWRLPEIASGEPFRRLLCAS